MFGCLLVTGGLCHAQLIAENPDWRDGAEATPPAFDVTRLVPIDTPTGSTLRFGVDPQTLSITPDGVVRYVIIARHTSGAQNVAYEGVRCSTGTFRVYARHDPVRGWQRVDDSVWAPLQGNGAARHALNFARAGGCEGRTVPSQTATIVRALRHPPRMGGDGL